MEFFDNLQQSFDNRELYFKEKDDNKQELIDKQISIIEQDAIKNYGDMAVNAISEYIMNEDGMPDDVTLNFKEFIISAILDKSLNLDIDNIVHSAIEWKAKQIVENDND